MDKDELLPVNVFSFEADVKTFEDFGHANDIFYWYATELMKFLGYESFTVFQQGPINRAIVACNALNIPIMDNFIQCKRDVDGKEQVDYKLTRFACYLVAMNGDVKKPNVAAAQVYFASLAESFQKYIQEADNVERVAIREDVSEREKSLHGVAHKAGVENYAYFQSAGYRGMYNMPFSRLKIIKGATGSKSPLDFMGKEELAANLFRITQTELKIKKDNVRGQMPLEAAAEHVGQRVRATMIELSGTTPESLPPVQDISKVRSELKRTHKGFKKLDTPKKKK